MAENRFPAGSASSVRTGPSFPEGVVGPARAVTGRRAPSVHTTEEVEHRSRSVLIARDLAGYQEEYGAFTEQERAWARTELSGERGDTA
ncbi:hypothetical protein [Nocardiopsis dassonvillei]|uniref:hypothetical protein n=1 Tax=Nocardiopsis dassonvillei TaxID=2014 RepID=UPI003643DC02